MKNKTPIHFITGFLLLVMIPRLPAAGTGPSEAVDISVDPSKAGAAIPPNFIGVSYETETVLPNGKGIHYFRPDNGALIEQFKVLGIKSLRIGGSSVDLKKVAIPAPADIDALFQFAKAAGVKVIYSVRLKEGDPQSAATIAKYIQDHYADSLDTFAIGNEPADYHHGYNYDIYRGDWKRIMDAMAAAAPGARFSGPDINPNAKWYRDFVTDFASTGHLALLTGHLYPGGCSYKNPGQVIKNLIPNDPAVCRGHMLSPQWYGTYERDRSGLAAAVADKGMPYRLGETNSFWYGGLKGASDSYASALWGLDYLHWWAANGAAGINFHTGDQVAGPIPCQYAVFITSDKGYHTHPLGYGMKAFDLGGYGNAVPVTIDKSNKVNLAAYASEEGLKTLSVTVINKGYGPVAPDAEVHLHLASPTVAGGAQVIFLSAPSSDIGVTSGVTLGGAAIDDDGSWKGKWTPLPALADGSGIVIKVSPASAAIVKAQLR